MTRVTNEELAASLDELFGQLAEIADRQEALYQLLANRDRHYLTLGAHLERLLAKDREQMRALGILKLVERANAETGDRDQSSAELAADARARAYERDYYAKVQVPCHIAGCQHQATHMSHDGNFYCSHHTADHPARRAAPLFEKIAASPLMKGEKK